jgi:hypothetical protein
MLDDGCDMEETDCGEVRSSRGNRGWGRYRVRSATGWRRRYGGIERRTVQGDGGGSCVGEG